MALYRYTLTPHGLNERKQIGWRRNGMHQIVGVCNFTSDGRADVLGIRRDGTLWAYPGTKDARLGASRKVGRGRPVRSETFTLALSPGDLTGDGPYNLLGQSRNGRLFPCETSGSDAGAPSV